MAGIPVRNLAGVLIGVNLIGLISIHWVWKGVRLLTLQRLLGSAIGALIPLVILLPIGFSVPVGFWYAVV